MKTTRRQFPLLFAMQLSLVTNVASWSPSSSQVLSRPARHMAPSTHHQQSRTARWALPLPSSSTCGCFMCDGSRRGAAMLPPLALSCGEKRESKTCRRTGQSCHPSTRTEQSSAPSPTWAPANPTIVNRPATHPQETPIPDALPAACVQRWASTHEAECRLSCHLQDRGQHQGRGIMGGGTSPSPSPSLLLYSSIPFSSPLITPKHPLDST